ncbi:hypothetical protein [Tellurirhabdus rosea]|uniref:hypothetical protein n=1 Tax=Tellurirhabdus rosea TaxID=2674997 RepID=UPI0022539C11|nr:hypothetical protein [Tellurirhabdus rosea]
MNAASVQNLPTATNLAMRPNQPEWEQAMSVFYGNFYHIQLLLEKADQYKPNQVNEFRRIQELMMIALTELHDDLDCPMSSARMLVRHTDIINSLNGRVAVVLAHA